MLELRIIAAGTTMPVFDLPAALGRRGAAKEIGDQIDALIAFMDELGGDPDLEEEPDGEPSGDEQDVAWLEPSADMRQPASMRAGAANEDDEEDDDDTAADDGPCDGEEDSEPGTLPEWGSPVMDGRCYADDEQEDDEPEARAHHVRRLRATRCDMRRDGYTGRPRYYLRSNGVVTISGVEVRGL
ncbi:hypothetical protein [Sphingomonas aracearum]|uniref:Uncharacterized protein n=1 Tax=Sphingomonas aracearum TaxID=2283317 RepID=A0A369VXB2_9SPHN|nr:hypothetical protein [Sphingomonas aracearum]RDE06227.1 hypothetical protein DVW87_00355 [Sphingomonas aracearum]